ncbi:MAG: STAS/SEC14 domain-containing protein [Polyangiaceae bacterium]|nr:STAS/SEC14 domain-containing protein [Polyangiaceae bacterium]
MSGELESHVRFEPPDLCVAVFIGDIDAPLMRRMNDQLRRAAEGRDYIFMLIDQTRAGSISAEARKLGVEGVKGIHVRDSAVIGASFHVRTIMTLVTRVIRLVRGEKGELIQFFATEAEARAYLAERRLTLFGNRGDTAERK